MELHVIERTEHAHVLKDGSETTVKFHVLTVTTDKIANIVAASRLVKRVRHVIQSPVLCLVLPVSMVLIVNWSAIDFCMEKIVNLIVRVTSNIQKSAILKRANVFVKKDTRVKSKCESEASPLIVRLHWFLL
jgi:hypothetical protein